MGGSGAGVNVPEIVNIEGVDWVRGSTSASLLYILGGGASSESDDDISVDVWICLIYSRGSASTSFRLMLQY